MAYDVIAPPGSFDRWPPGLVAEMRANQEAAVVGSTLVSETDTVRVWHLLVPAGSRCAFHVHVLDYFWTCHSKGEARSYNEDGSISAAAYQPGDTMHLTYAKGERLLHSLDNVGKTDLLFTTVEFLDSANAPLSVPDNVRVRRTA